MIAERRYPSSLPADGPGRDQHDAESQVQRPHVTPFHTPINTKWRDFLTRFAIARLYVSAYSSRMQHISDDVFTAFIAAAEARRDDRKNAAYAEIETADRDFVEDMAAIARLKGLSPSSIPAAGVAPTPPTQPRVSPNGNGRHEWPGLRAAVRAAVNAKVGPFNLDDVMESLERHFQRHPSLKRSYVSAELWRMKRDGKTIVVEEGSGNRPATYRVNDRAELLGGAPRN